MPATTGIIIELPYVTDVRTLSSSSHTCEPMLSVARVQIVLAKPDVAVPHICPAAPPVKRTMLRPSPSSVHAPPLSLNIILVPKLLLQFVTDTLATTYIIPLSSYAISLGLAPVMVVPVEPLITVPAYVMAVVVALPVLLVLNVTTLVVLGTI